MSVFTYSRFSTDRQTEASIVDQQRVQREWAARNNVVITHNFVDEAISGAAVGNRPGFLDMMATVCAGDVLVLSQLDRLSRSQDLAPMVERLRFRGVRVVGVADGFDSNAPTARMQAGLSGLMSDELRANIRARTHMALETRAKAARPTGGRAYGYDNSGQPVEPEASIAVEIFRRYSGGEAMLDIATDLNARGIPSPGSTWNRRKRRQDGRWLVSALHAVLANERYIGRVVWNRSIWVKDPDSGKRTRRERPQSEWIVNEGPALVDAETWRRVRARLSERATLYGGNRGGGPRYLLSGILICEFCSARMIVSGNKGSTYYCATHRQGGPSACTMSIGVRRELAEDIILQPARDELFSPAAIDRATGLIRQWHRQDRARSVQVPSPEIAKVEAEVAGLQQMITSSPALADRLRVALEAAQRELEALRRRAWRQAAAMGDDEEVPAERAYRHYVAKMGELLDSTNIVGARNVLRSVLDDVPVWPHESGSHLMARVGLNPVPLLRAAGIAWAGSGGRI